MLIIYTKTNCPWCIEAVEYLREKGIEFEERNVFEETKYFTELKDKSEQEKCPTLDLDGEILADVGKEEIEEFLISKGII